MLDRFSKAIPGKGYTRVVILGGTNDVLEGIAPDVTIRNLEEIATRTLKAGAQPVICEIPPIVHSFNPKDNRDYSPEVRALNGRIAALAAEHQWTLVDYYDAMRGHPSFFSDGVHLKRRGYAVMEWDYLRQVSAR
jgi:lysophospholipase L1-like esterase